MEVYYYTHDRRESHNTETAPGHIEINSLTRITNEIYKISPARRHYLCTEAHDYIY